MIIFIFFYHHDISQELLFIIIILSHHFVQCRSSCTTSRRCLKLPEPNYKKNQPPKNKPTQHNPKPTKPNQHHHHPPNQKNHTISWRQRPTPFQYIKVRYIFKTQMLVFSFCHHSISQELLFIIIILPLGLRWTPQVSARLRKRYN